MKFSCEKGLLLSAVTTASRAAAAKSAVPSLEGLLIEAGSDVVISGYDLKTGIRCTIAADVAETGNVVINARLFGDIIRKLPDDIVYVNVDEKFMINIKCGMSEFNIMGISAEEYPELPYVDYQNSVYMMEKDLKAMIAETNFAVSDNEARPIHTGALFEVENEILTIVAVDGYRLALRRERVAKTEVGKVDFVVPGTALSEVEKIASDSEELVKITLGSKHIMFTIGSTMLISRRLEGEFLNYRNSIPQASKYSIEADRKALIESIERVSLIISDKFKSPVRCVFDSGILKVSTATTLGKANDECQVSGDGEGLEIGFNNRYILEALKAAPSDSVRLQLSTGVSPCVLVPTDGNKNFIYMILPVRLRANEG
ncbi:MAG: DNA polymerase III subunit beta [Oscillospiraceae bacterium]